MAAAITNDLKSFHRFVGEQLTNGGARLTPEEVWNMWRERQDSIAAVREGIEAVDAGRTKPLEEFIKDFRARHAIPEKQ